MRNYLKQLPRKVAFALGFLLLLIIGTYLCRNILIGYLAEKRIGEMERRYGLTIGYESLQLKGIHRICLNGLSVVPAERDTLLSLKSLQVHFNPWKMVGGKFHVKRVEMDGLDLSFVKQDSVANYDFLFMPGQHTESLPTEEAASIHLASRTDRMLSLLYNMLPENGTLTHLNISERKNDRFVRFTIPFFHIARNHFQSEIQIHEDSLRQQWTTEGELNRPERRIQAKLYASEKGESVTLPYLNRRFATEISFDSLTYSLTQTSRSSQQTTLQGKAQVNGLQVYNAYLSPEAINLNHGAVDYTFHITANSVEMDSVSRIDFNQLNFHPYLKAEKGDSAWHFTASVNKGPFPSQELFGSLPKGLFYNLEGLQTSGELTYHFFMDVDFALLDSLKFESSLQKKGFRIDQFGATDLRKMSEEFEYTVYEHGEPVRTFPVGPSWEHFTPLDSIPLMLQMSILQSEDNAFFVHRGFLPDAIREALIQDLKERRFARGGSTISMQLVKNVFLNRRKNIARKLEEALIVWLIENEQLTPKERMYEVYLNIVEWAPMVYGACEAARFYFDKRPSQLTLEECIFLAHIIPFPKHFKWSFTDDMRLKESLEGYYQIIADRLALRGIISEGQALSVRPEVVLKGEAVKYFIKEEEETNEEVTSSQFLEP